MEDYNYKSNSHKSKESTVTENTSEKKVEKIVNGVVKSKKKTGFGKFRDAIISEDAENVKSYILLDVVIPALKKGIFDTITNGLDMVLYGENGRNRRRGNSSTVSYNRYYDDERRRSRPSMRSDQRYSYDDIILESRGEAEEVLARMDELIDTYEVVSVADLYDLVGIQGRHTDNKYGWTSMRAASVVRTRDGYMLKLPKALPLD